MKLGYVKVTAVVEDGKIRRIRTETSFGFVATVEFMWGASEILAQDLMQDLEEMYCITELISGEYDIEINVEKEGKEILLVIYTALSSSLAIDILCKAIGLVQEMYIQNTNQ